MFRNCEYLVSFTIPRGVEIIKDGAFYNCSSLVNMTIPDTVVEIKDEELDDDGIIVDDPFGDCDNLKNVTYIVYNENTIIDIEGNEILKIINRINENEMEIEIIDVASFETLLLFLDVSDEGLYIEELDDWHFMKRKVTEFLWTCNKILN